MDETMVRAALRHHWEDAGTSEGQGVCTACLSSPQRRLHMIIG